VAAWAWDSSVISKTIVMGSWQPRQNSRNATLLMGLAVASPDSHVLTFPFPAANNSLGCQLGCQMAVRDERMVEIGKFSKHCGAGDRT